MRGQAIRIFMESVQLPGLQWSQILVDYSNLENYAVKQNRWLILLKK